ncbi:putative protein without homology [Propionibacterium freudenreichii subsp. shermanii]|nr:putative protein without homology [Propionibacterium freudenreichii subsp. shermanii]
MGMSLRGRHHAPQPTCGRGRRTQGWHGDQPIAGARRSSSPPLPAAGHTGTIAG